MLALIDARERHHSIVDATYREDPGPHVIPAAALGEIGYFLTPRSSTRFLGDLVAGTFELDCGDRDLFRATAISRRYESMGLGLVDAAVIACAIRRGGRVLTLDRRHFDVVARELPLTILP